MLSNEDFLIFIRKLQFISHTKVKRGQPRKKKQT